ncbi:MAG: biopolymer transporter ExbD [Bacteroidales bacterium]|nr:biopolymer transporter ExbD [Bacteroidales bacterium]
MAKKCPEINAGSMADISFLLLIFFLTATTMDVDTGIARRLPPPLDPTQEPPDIKKRNILDVFVNKNNRLMVGGRPCDISQLKEKTIEFIANPTNYEHYSEKREVEIPELGGTMQVSRGIISLKNDRGTAYDMYIQVQNELASAVDQLRDELCKEKFGVNFVDLKDEEKIKAIQKAVPVAISEAEPEEIK